MMLDVNVSNLIQKRKEKNLSQYRLSILAGLPGNAVFRMEQGNHKVNNLRAELIAKTLNCDIKELFHTSNQ